MTGTVLSVGSFTLRGRWRCGSALLSWANRCAFAGSSKGTEERMAGSTGKNVAL
jgi:hypothetical protein